MRQDDGVADTKRILVRPVRREKLPKKMVRWLPTSGVYDDRNGTAMYVATSTAAATLQQYEDRSLEREYSNLRPLLPIHVSAWLLCWVWLHHRRRACCRIKVSFLILYKINENVCQALYSVCFCLMTRKKPSVSLFF